MHVCLNCGTPNPPEASECEGCGMSLTGGPALQPIPDPHADQSSEQHAATTSAGHADDLTTRYDEFASQVEGLRVGSVSPAAFVEWLTEARQRMWQRRDAFLAAAETCGDEDGDGQVLEAAEAIIEFDDAIEEMWAFTLGQTGVSGLDSALARMWDANQRINQAMRKNRDFRASLDEEWGFM